MEFKNVTLIKEANVYDNGKVSSRVFYLESKEKKTLGFMLAGEYTFNTNEEELMEVLNGEMKAKLPSEETFKSYKKGESFSVPANSSFDVIVAEFADYCCSYIK